MSRTGHWLADSGARLRRLQAPTARRILAVLEEAPDGLTAGQIAEQTGVGFSYVQDILAAAVKAGLAQGAPTAALKGGRRGRPPWRYRTVADPTVL